VVSAGSGQRGSTSLCLHGTNAEASAAVSGYGAGRDKSHLRRNAAAKPAGMPAVSWEQGGP
jgi:hypothetical protein